jgi:cellobiose-specific phosphotransferase system component IIB
MPGTCNSKGVLVSIEEIAESKLTFEHEEWKQAALVTPQIKFEENRNSFGQKKNVSPPQNYVFREFIKFKKN